MTTRRTLALAAAAALALASNSAVLAQKGPLQ